MFEYIEPEVAGGLGSGTKMDVSQHPPKIFELEYEFAGWMGDDILETFPCYIVTERLRESIEFSKLSGVEFSNVNVITTPEFKEANPEKSLPQFHWMKVTGKAGLDDFGIAKDLRLVISFAVKKLLNKFQVRQATFEEFI